MIRLLFYFFLFIGPLFSEATVFVYHRFGDTRYPSTSISTDKLRTDFTYLKKEGYHVISLRELSHYLHTNTPIPPKSVVLTIDDSYKSFYQNGLPVFKEFNYPFTLFVYTEATDKRYGDFMSWDELKETSKYGDLGLHSHRHGHLVTYKNSSLKKDTLIGITLFEKHLGIRPTMYAYPYGEFDQQTQSVLKSLGFTTICNQNSGAVAEHSSPYDIDRIAVMDDTSIISKLKIRALPLIWEKGFPKVEDEHITQLRAKVNLPNLKHVKIYLSGYGWENAKLQDGTLNIQLNKKLKFKRSRLIIKADNSHHQATKLIMKGKKHVK